MAIDIRKRIRYLRKAKGMSAKDVSERMGISRPFYTQLEGGTRRISIKYLEGIARALSTTVADLYSEDRVPVFSEVATRSVVDGGPQELAEKLRPYLGKDSDTAAESVYHIDRAAKTLRKFKSDEKR